ncbi:MAG: hypothetical protein R3C18_26310 [Planctomycetaceae bacterium]
MDHPRAAPSVSSNPKVVLEKACANSSKPSRNDYWQAVTDVAENVVADLEDDDENDRDELISRLIAEKCDQHDYVIGVDLCIHTLRYSNNSCAGFFDGTFAANHFARNAEFPFSDLAADAFEADVSDKVNELLCTD